MVTTGELIRDKAQNILLLQTLFKAQKAQQDKDSMDNTLSKLVNCAEEVQTISMDGDSFEGLIVYSNATSFILRAYNEMGVHEMALPYSLYIANSAFTLIYSLEVRAPKTINNDQMANIKIGYLAQVIKSYLDALNVDANPILRQPGVLEPFSDLMGAFVATYENLKRSAPQSGMIQALASFYSMSRRNANPDSINDDTEFILDTCGVLYDLIIKSEMNND